jgi:hypothetical protein
MYNYYIIPALRVPYFGMAMSIRVTLPRLVSGASKSFSLPSTRMTNWSLARNRVDGGVLHHAAVRRILAVNYPPTLAERNGLRIVVAPRNGVALLNLGKLDLFLWERRMLPPVRITVPVIAARPILPAGCQRPPARSWQTR